MIRLQFLEWPSVGTAIFLNQGTVISLEQLDVSNWMDRIHVQGESETLYISQSFLVDGNTLGRVRQ
jgi:hypothetical protein